jgi:hypothetical protein
VPFSQPAEVFRDARPDETVIDQHILAAGGQRVDKVAAEEACPAGDDDMRVRTGTRAGLCSSQPDDVLGGALFLAD